MKKEDKELTKKKKDLPWFVFSFLIITPFFVATGLTGDMIYVTIAMMGGGLLLLSTMFYGGLKSSGII